MNLTFEKEVHSQIEKLTPKYIEFLKSLVKIPSEIGREGQAQAFLTRELRKLEIEITEVEVDPKRLSHIPGFNPTARSYHNRPCIVGVLKGKGGGRSMVLNAHIDTAPVGDPQAWELPPHSGTIINGEMFGRGTWDDKAGITECVMILEAIQKSGISLKGDLIFKSVIEDEATGNGTLACLAEGFRGDGAIILDGTWPERFVVSHMGQLWFRIEIKGKSAPACVASRGRNPINAVGLLNEALQSFVEKKNSTLSQTWGNSSQPVFINIGKIIAGDWPGSVPSTCTLEGQYGFLPVDTTQDARAHLSQLIQDLITHPKWPEGLSVQLEFWGLETNPLIGNPENSVATLIKKSIKRLRGSDLLENRISGHCDLRHYFSPPFGPSIPACLYGPGGGKNAHVENESFRLDHLTLVAQNIASVVLEWCDIA